MALDGVQHSRCIQLSIREPSEAGSAFNSSGTNNICLVAIPDSPFCCCQPYVNVPSGYICLYQRWYKNQGQRDPGATFCWPFWYRVSHVVNAATITYSAPSRQVPTADNVSRSVRPHRPCGVPPSRLLCRHAGGAPRPPHTSSRRGWHR